MRVKLTNVQINRRMSEETTNFAATIHLDGERIGTVGNDGHGGSNRYHFDSAEARGKFDDYVALWSQERGETFEPRDALIGAVLERWEVEKQARANLKKGFPVTALCRRGRESWGWQETFVVGFRDRNDVDEWVKRENVDAYEIVEVEPPAHKRGRRRG